MGAARNVVPSQANHAKKFLGNLATLYLGKYQNRTANKFLANLVSLFLVNNADQYPASNVVQCLHKSAEMSQLKCVALEEVVSEAPDQGADTAKEEDTDIMVKTHFMLIKTLHCIRFQNTACQTSILHTQIHL